ncbi:hypothetical protein BKA83DRAFT_4181258 [Pisolithus microcarpus]|nr:hypothetical protein BKA83DRAFT_4181258 [Pisolithus microcarpus]
MSLYSLVGNKFHLQLQRLVHLHPPAPILTAFVLLTSVPLLCAGPSTFASGLPLSWWRRLAKLDLTPDRVATLFQALVHAVTTTCLRIRINVRLPDLWRCGHARCQESDTYRTPHEEARYWRLAERYRRRLYSGGTQVQAKLELGFRNTRSYVSAQLVEYYTPRLLPVYREMGRSGNSQEADAAFTISPKTYCKWHRMVFPDRPHPTLTQAARRIKQHSPRDLREILRISRLAPIGKAFRADGDQERYTTKYKKLWQAYLDQRSMDLVIVFE